MKLWKPANSGEFWSKESARADWWLRTLLLQFCNWLDAAAREGAAGFSLLHDGYGAAILRPARNVVTNGYRAFLTKRLRRDALLVDATGDEVVHDD